MILLNEICLIITNLPGNTSEMTLAANKLTHISTNNITTYNNEYTQMISIDQTIRLGFLD